MLFENEFQDYWSMNWCDRQGLWFVASVLQEVPLENSFELLEGF